MASASGFCLETNSCDLSILSWAAPLRRCTGEAICISFNEGRKPWSLQAVLFHRPQTNCGERCQIWRFCVLLTACVFFPLVFTSKAIQSLCFYCELRILRLFLRMCLKLITVGRKLGPITRNRGGIELLFVKRIRTTHKIALCFSWFYIFQMQSHPARLYQDDFTEGERAFLKSNTESRHSVQQALIYWIFIHAAFWPYCTLVTTWTFLDLSSPKSITSREVKDGAQPEHRQK